MSGEPGSSDNPQIASGRDRPFPRDGALRRLLALVAVALLLPLGAASFVGGTSTGGASRTPLATVAVTEVGFLHFSDRVSQLGYSPDGLHLAVAIDSGSLYVLNATTFSEELNLTVPFGWVGVSSLSWSPESDHLAAGYQGGAVGVWDIPSGVMLWSQQDLYFDVRGVSWSPDGQYLAAGILHAVYIFLGNNGSLTATSSKPTRVSTAEIWTAATGSCS